MDQKEALDKYRQYVSENPADRNGARRSFYDKFGVDPEAGAQSLGMPKPRSAADLQAMGTEGARELIQREVAANEALREAKARIATNAIPAVGTLAAGIATGPASLPVALGGAALAGVGFEGIRQGVSQATGLEEPYTREQAAKGMLKEGVLNLGAEGLGRTVGWLGKKIVGAVMPRIRPEDAAVFAAAKNAKAPLTAAEVTRGGLSKTLQRLADRTSLGEEVGQLRREQVSDAMAKYIGDAMDAVSDPTSPLQTAAKAKGLVNTVRDGWKGTAKTMFDGARQAAPKGFVVKTDDFVSAAEKLMQRGDNLRDVLPNVMKELTPEENVLKTFLNDIQTTEVGPQLFGASGKALPQSITKTNEPMSIGQATELRKLLNEKYHQYLSKGDRQASALMKEMGDAVETSLEAQVGPNSQYIKELKAAKAFYKEGMDLWDTAIMSDLLNKNPSEVLSTINVRDPESIRILDKAFTRWGNVPEGKALIRRQAMQDIFRDATWRDKAESGISPKLLKDSLKRLEPAAEKYIFRGDKQGVEAYRRLEEYIAIGERVEKIRKGAGDRLLANVAMLGWGIAHQSGAMVAAAGASAAVPSMLARTVNDPIASLHITNAMRHYEKGLTNPKHWAMYAAEAARLAEYVTRQKWSMDDAGWAEEELASIQTERKAKGIPQRGRYDR